MSHTQVNDTSSSKQSVDKLAEVLWNYHHLNTDLRNNDGVIRADCLIVCGSNEEQVAERAANLYLRGHIGKIIFSGGNVHERLEDKFGKHVTEAEAFAKIAIEHGVPPDVIRVENNARNTPQNIRLSKQLLDASDNNIIVICAAQHERRSLATAKQWLPGKVISVTSPAVSFDDFIHDPTYREGRIRALVGHTLRLYVYGQKGDLVPQEMPVTVLDAYRELIHRGYMPLALDSLKEDLEKLQINPDLSELHDKIKESKPSKPDLVRSSPEHRLTTG